MKTKKNLIIWSVIIAGLIELSTIEEGYYFSAIEFIGSILGVFVIVFIISRLMNIIRKPKTA